MNSSEPEISAIRTEVSEVILMAAYTQWRQSYNNALHACGNKIVQERKADLAINACVQRLSEITPRDPSEREEISTALDDLKLLKLLYSAHG